MNVPHRMRAGVVGDLPFLFRSWLDSYRNSEFARGIRTSDYYDLHHRVAEGFIANGTVIVACGESEESVILGWACFDAEAVHYLFVKEHYRRRGLGRALLDAASREHKILTTHRTYDGVKLVHACRREIRYSPYLAFGTPREQDNGEEQQRQRTDA